MMYSLECVELQPDGQPDQKSVDSDPDVCSRDLLWRKRQPVERARLVLMKPYFNGMRNSLHKIPRRTCFFVCIRSQRFLVPWSPGH